MSKVKVENKKRMCKLCEAHGFSMPYESGHSNSCGYNKNDHIISCKKCEKVKITRGIKSKGVAVVRERQKGFQSGGNGTRNFKTNSPNSEKSGNIVSLFIASCSVSQNTTSNSTAKQSDRMIQIGDQGFKMKDVRHILGEFALFMLEHFEMESDGNNNHQTSSRDNKTTVKEAEGVDKGNEDMSKKGTSAEVSSAAKKRMYPGNDNSQPKRKFVDFVNSTEYFSPLEDDDGLPKDAEYYSLLHPDPALNQEELSALYISNFAKKVTGIFSDGYDEEGDDGTNTKIISDLTSMIKDGSTLTELADNDLHPYLEHADWGLPGLPHPYNEDNNSLDPVVAESVDIEMNNVTPKNEDELLKIYSGKF